MIILIREMIRVILMWSLCKITTEINVRYPWLHATIKGLYMEATPLKFYSTEGETWTLKLIYNELNYIKNNIKFVSKTSNEYFLRILKKFSSSFKFTALDLFRKFKNQIITFLNHWNFFQILAKKFLSSETTKLTDDSLRKILYKQFKFSIYLTYLIHVKILNAINQKVSISISFEMILKIYLPGIDDMGEAFPSSHLQSTI